MLSNIAYLACFSHGWQEHGEDRKTTQGHENAKVAVMSCRTSKHLLYSHDKANMLWKKHIARNQTKWHQWAPHGLYHLVMHEPYSYVCVCVLAHKIVVNLCKLRPPELVYTLD